MALQKEDLEKSTKPIPNPGSFIGPGFPPTIYPPPPTRPAMNVEFGYALGEPVTVPALGLEGVIVAAAVAFQQSSIIYLVETGQSPEKWYPERMVQPAHQYHVDPLAAAEEAGPTATAEEKADEAD